MNIENHMVYTGDNPELSKGKSYLLEYYSINVICTQNEAGYFKDYPREDFKTPYEFIERNKQTITAEMYNGGADFTLSLTNRRLTLQKNNEIVFKDMPPAAVVALKRLLNEVYP